MLPTKITSTQIEMCKTGISRGSSTRRTAYFMSQNYPVIVEVEFGRLPNESAAKGVYQTREERGTYGPDGHLIQSQVSRLNPYAHQGISMELQPPHTVTQ